MPLITWQSAAAITTLAALASPAWAQQMYKCAQPDGNTAFQDRPRHMSGSTGGSVTVTVTSPSRDTPPLTPQQRQRPRPPTASDQAAQKQRQQQQMDDQQRNARSHLGTLKAYRPVFQCANKGEKHYLDDSKLQSEMTAAWRGVAGNCR